MDRTDKQVEYQKADEINKWEFRLEGVTFEAKTFLNQIGHFRNSSEEIKVRWLKEQVGSIIYCFGLGEWKTAIGFEIELEGVVLNEF